MHAKNNLNFVFCPVQQKMVKINYGIKEKYIIIYCYITGV
jgi:hypothetical protein